MHWEKLLFLYLGLARKQALTLPDDLRSRACGWISKIEAAPSDDEEAQKLQLHALKLLLLSLERNCLAGPFDDAPNEKSFPEYDWGGYEMLEFSTVILQTEQVAYPNTSYSVTGNRRVLLTYQDGPKTAQHCYFAISDEPVDKWDNLNNSAIPDKTLSDWQERGEWDLLDQVDSQSMREDAQSGEGGEGGEGGEEGEEGEGSDVNVQDDHPPTAPSKSEGPITEAARSPVPKTIASSTPLPMTSLQAMSGFGAQSMTCPALRAMRSPSPLSMTCPALQAMKGPSPQSMTSPPAMSIPGPQSMTCPAPQAMSGRGLQSMTSPTSQAMSIPGPQSMTYPAPQAMSGRGLQSMTSPTSQAMSIPGQQSMTCPAPQATSGPTSQSMTSPQAKSGSGAQSMTCPAPRAMRSPSPQYMTSPTSQSMTSPQAMSGSGAQSMTCPAPRAMRSPSPQYMTSPTSQSMTSPQAMSGSGAQSMTCPAPRAMRSPSPQYMTSPTSQSMSGSGAQSMTCPAPRAKSDPGPQTMTNQQAMSGPGVQSMTCPAPRAVRSPSPQSMTSPSPKAMNGPGPQPMTSPQAMSGPGAQSMTCPAPRAMRSPSPQSMTSPSPKVMSGPGPQPMTSPQAMSGPGAQSMTCPAPRAMRGPSPQSMTSQAMSGPGAQSMTCPAARAMNSPSPQAMTCPAPQIKREPGQQTMTCPAPQTMWPSAAKTKMPYKFETDQEPSAASRKFKVEPYSDYGPEEYGPIKEEMFHSPCGRNVKEYDQYESPPQRISPLQCPRLKRPQVSDEVQDAMELQAPCFDVRDASMQRMGTRMPENDDRMYQCRNQVESEVDSVPETDVPTEEDDMQQPRIASAGKDNDANMEMFKLPGESILKRDMVRLETTEEFTAEGRVVTEELLEEKEMNVIPRFKLNDKSIPSLMSPPSCNRPALSWRNGKSAAQSVCHGRRSLSEGRQTIQTRSILRPECRTQPMANASKRLKSICDMGFASSDTQRGYNEEELVSAVEKLRKAAKKACRGRQSAPRDMHGIGPTDGTPEGEVNGLECRFGYQQDELGFPPVMDAYESEFDPEFEQTPFRSESQPAFLMDDIQTDSASNASPACSGRQLPSDQDDSSANQPAASADDIYEPEYAQQYECPAKPKSLKYGVAEYSSSKRRTPHLETEERLNAVCTEFQPSSNDYTPIPRGAKPLQPPRRLLPEYADMPSEDLDEVSEPSSLMECS